MLFCITSSVIKLRFIKSIIKSKFFWDKAFVNISVSEFEAYKTTNCLNTKVCQYPVIFSTPSSGTLSIDNINFTQRLVDIPNVSAKFEVTNLSLLEGTTFWNWTTNFLGGALTFYDLDIKFAGSKNISIGVHTTVNTTLNPAFGNNTINVDMEGFKKGMYLLKFTNPSGIIIENQKIVKQ